LKKTLYPMEIVMDESAWGSLEQKLEGRNISVVRHEPGITDDKVLEFAFNRDSPLLVADKDFTFIDEESGEHPGILADKYMHRREWNLVADTVKWILENVPEEELSDNIWYLSDYYGVI